MAKEVLICGVCGQVSDEFDPDIEDETCETILDEWRPYAYRGDVEFSPVCPEHETKIGVDGEVELI